MNEIKIALYKHGEFVCQCKSQKEAAAIIGVNPGLISRAISSGLCYLQGYRFKRIGYHPKGKNIKVDLYHHGHKLCTYNSIKQASEATGVSDSAITKALMDDIGKVNEYIFKPHKDERKRIKE